MKRIDVVELYVRKRIEILERENGEYKVNQKEINELKDVLDVIAKTRTVRCGKTLTKINVLMLINSSNKLPAIYKD